MSVSDRVYYELNVHTHNAIYFVLYTLQWKLIYHTYTTLTWCENDLLLQRDMSNKTQDDLAAIHPNTCERNVHY